MKIFLPFLSDKNIVLRRSELIDMKFIQGKIFSYKVYGITA